MVAAALAAGWRPQAVFLRRGGRGSTLGRAPRPRSAPRPSSPSPSASPRASPRSRRRPTSWPCCRCRSAGRWRRCSGRPPAPRPRRCAARAARAAAGAPGAGLLVVYVDGVQDPGNVGTLIRAAVAFGAAALVTSPGSADLYGPKTVRAGMGAALRPAGVPGAAARPTLRRRSCRRRRVYGLGRPRRRRRCDAADLRRPAVLVVGAERAGLSGAGARARRPAGHDPAVGAVRPARSRVLNAGVAGAIALYEFSRRPRRRLRRPARRRPRGARKDDHGRRTPAGPANSERPGSRPSTTPAARPSLRAGRPGRARAGARAGAGAQERAHRVPALHPRACRPRSGRWSARAAT